MNAMKRNVVFAVMMAGVMLTAVLAGCGLKSGDTHANNAGQTVLNVYGQYTQLAEAADAYGKQPFCDKAPMPCADRTVVLRLEAVRAASEPAIQNAKAAVLDPKFNSDVDGARWQAVAEAALNALRQICTSTSPGAVCVPVPNPTP